MATTTVPTRDDSKNRTKASSEVVCLFLVLALALLAHLTIREFTDPAPFGDELRYLEQAVAFASGQPMYPDDIVKNPPLFPVLLSLVLRAGVPEQGLALLSITLMVLAAGFLFLVLRRFLALPAATLLACVFTLYPPNLLLGSRIMTEPLAAMLLLLVCIQLFDARPGNLPSLPKLLTTAALLALLALTKPVFAYAFVVAIIICLLLAVITDAATRKFRLRLCLILSLALLACTPYLAFTHSLTGKYFAWVTSDAEHIYWMSIGGEDIWGNWLPVTEARNRQIFIDAGVANELDTAAGMDAVAASTYLRKRAIERISADPLLYLRNVVANTTRLLFNYPFSFRPQSLLTYGYVLPNMILYLALLVSVALLPVTIRHQNRGLIAVVVLSLIYLCGNLPVSSAARQGVVVFGPLLLWIAYQSHILLRLGYVNLQGPRPTQRSLE